MAHHIAPPPSARRAKAAWCFYDWANSAFPTVIVTFVFAAYFAKAVAPNPTEGTTMWGYALSASGIAIALISPVVGAIADMRGRRKPWLAGFTAICIVASALLWFTLPEPGSIVWGLTLFAIGNLAFEAGTVFYNAMLPGLARPAEIGRLSGWGWGLGYAGGLCCLTLALVVFIQPETPTGKPLGTAVREGLATLGRTLRNIHRTGPIFRFLVARLVYIDGLNTLFAFGGIYAAGTFGMEVDEIILFGIALNVTAGLGAASFAWIDDWIGPKRTVLIALFALSGKVTAFLGPAMLATVTAVFASQRAGMATVLVFISVGALILMTVRSGSRI